jgi:hypothetical protein
MKKRRGFWASKSPAVMLKVLKGSFLGLLGVLSVSLLFAQSIGPQPAHANPKLPAVVVPSISSKPTWLELSPAQRISLKPLAANWNGLGEGQKRKWIAIARNYQNLTSAEQATLHSRMTEWVSLSQEQRAVARLNFAESRQLTAPQKAATWQEYQALSPEEKKSLANLAVPKPAGAALATKPIAPKKLATIPASKLLPIKKQ